MTKKNEEWLQAGMALILKPSDPKPLAAMLRGDTPVPPGIRDTRLKP